MQLHAIVEPAPEAQDHLASALGPYLESAELDWVEPEQWILKLSSFGRLALDDLISLQECIALEARQFAPFELHFGTIVPFPEEHDTSVWAELDGDLESLTSLAFAIPRWVHPLGFVLDRRSFRTRIRLADINDATTAPTLERLVEAFSGYRGPAWRVECVTLAEHRPPDSLGGHRRYGGQRRLAFAGITQEALPEVEDSLAEVVGSLPEVVDSLPEVEGSPAGDEPGHERDGGLPLVTGTGASVAAEEPPKPPTHWPS